MRYWARAGWFVLPIRWHHSVSEDSMYLSGLQYKEARQSRQAFKRLYPAPVGKTFESPPQIDCNEKEAPDVIRALVNSLNSRKTESSFFG
jgi:hypothetical protein